MQRDARAYLWDIARAAESIFVFTKDQTFRDYAASELLRAAVERKFGIVGEALSQLLRDFPAYRDRISQSPDIVAFRNQIVHGYTTVKDDIVWEVVQWYLPRLHQEVAQLLAELDPEAPRT
ncbi:MAG TPA: HepT-like ribonuclease domain-containing protein [Terracidiphilus sp.]|jgi:uncharacterized protein with HEPN domain|nr:HepT-like ribonuclease domain-containing protein [Terracidiphilus sp.]